MLLSAFVGARGWRIELPLAQKGQTDRPTQGIHSYRICSMISFHMLTSVFLCPWPGLTLKGFRIQIQSKVIFSEALCMTGAYSSLWKKHQLLRFSWILFEDWLALFRPGLGSCDVAGIWQDTFFMHLSLPQDQFRWVLDEYLDKFSTFQSWTLHRSVTVSEADPQKLDLFWLWSNPHFKDTALNLQPWLISKVICQLCHQISQLLKASNCGYISLCCSGVSS